jgi:hypothetical protein
MPAVQRQIRTACSSRHSASVNSQSAQSSGASGAIESVLRRGVASTFGNRARVMHEGQEGFAWLLGYEQMRRMFEPDHVFLRGAYLRELLSRDRGIYVFVKTASE